MVGKDSGLDVLAAGPKGGRREDKRGVGCVQLWSPRHLSDPPKHHLTFITLKICTEFFF